MVFGRMTSLAKHLQAFVLFPSAFCLKRQVLGFYLFNGLCLN